MINIANIGLSSILSYQNALTLSSQNIANVNTPSYSRREVDFAEAPGGSIFGNGVNIADVRRLYDAVTSQNLSSSESTFAQQKMLLQYQESLELLFDDSTNSIVTYLDNSFTALQQLTVSPDSYQSRTLYLNQLNRIATQLQNLSLQIQQQKNDVNYALNVDVNNVNEIISSIAKINQQMQGMSASAQNGLLDQREQLVQKLSGYLSFNSSTLDNGMLNIFLQNGLPLVLGDMTSTLNTTTDPVDPSKVEIFLQSSTMAIPITNYVQAGELTGLLQYRNNSLDYAAHGLGRLALAIAATFNQQNALGIDLSGNLGGNIFADVNDPSVINNRVIANSNNLGSGVMSVTIDDVSQLATSDYRVLFDSSSHYTVTRLADNKVVAAQTIAGFPDVLSFDGVSFQINSGSFSANDQFLISPTANAASNFNVQITNPLSLALALPVEVASGQNNQGQAIISLDQITNTKTSTFSIPQQLNPPIQIQFITATSYQLVNAQDQSIIEGPIVYDPMTGTNLFPTPNQYDPGYRVSITGAPRAGDSFNISFNNNGVGDNRNGLALLNLYDQAILGGGTLDFDEAYNLLSGDISLQVNSTQIAYDSAEVIKQQAQAQWDAISGVNMEEEIMRLIQFQQAYQASARILEVVKSMFDILMMIR